MKDHLMSKEEKREPSTFFCIYTAFHFIIMDVVLYGCIIPLIGTYIAGVLSFKFGLTPKWELLGTVFLTFGMIYGTFCCVGEASYWKHLFSFDSFYSSLLQARDVFNTFMFVVCLTGIGSTVEAMVNQDKIMKTVPVSEGVVYVFMKAILEFFDINPESALTPLGFKIPQKGVENEKFERGAAFMLLWAMLTGCVAKLVYYNTLFTYLRASEIFMSMKPIFDDEDDAYTGSGSKTTYFNGVGRTPSKLDEDFTHSVKRTHS